MPSRHSSWHLAHPYCRVFTYSMHPCSSAPSAHTTHVWLVPVPQPLHAKHLLIVLLQAQALAYQASTCYLCMASVVTSVVTCISHWPCDLVWTAWVSVSEPVSVSVHRAHLRLLQVAHPVDGVQHEALVLRQPVAGRCRHGAHLAAGTNAHVTPQKLWQRAAL
jgi:hypothetical protein